MGPQLLDDLCRRLCPGQHPWCREPEVSLHREVPGAQLIFSIGEICTQEGPDLVSLLNCLLIDESKCTSRNKAPLAAAP